ncbi:MAG: gamma-glutamyl-gamma-aminobutyrate hydrolase family protein [Rhodospirillales bacterium]|jgi:putative glutamine amidotransferase|nr:gamma-glutamyl-gamma-aminobutyrate hydrolase family protein [Rhodospirillales bacterium]
MQRPVIAVLLDYEAEGSFSSRPHYALRTSYFTAIERAGGVPIAIPYLPGSIEPILNIAHGVMLPGGFYPFPDHFYGEPRNADHPSHPRSAFENDFTRIILKYDMPVLGICAGMQVLGAIMGATLHRDVHDVVETHTDHLNEKPAEEAAHKVIVTEGSKLHSIVGSNTIDVNTAHREALNIVPQTIKVNAVAEDGVIEGIELPDQRFALGVQWHPEFFQETGGPHLALFEALIQAASEK